MASRVDFAVSATPVVTIAAGSEYPAVDTLATDVNKTLGSSGSATVTWGSTVGYAAGAPAYVQSGANSGDGQTALTLGIPASCKFIYIRHTGCIFSSTSVLGAVSAAQLRITMAATTAVATTVAWLNPGEAIVLPLNTASSVTLYASATQTGGVAVEVMATA
jgi:hypothetical protein